MATIPQTLVLANSSSTETFYCNACDRDFLSNASLQMHLQNSTFHKNDTRQRNSMETKKFVPTLSNEANAMFPVNQITMNRPEASFNYRNNHWTLIPPIQQLPSFEALKMLCHSTEELLKNKYLVKPYGPDEISMLRRCKNCQGEFHKLSSFEKLSKEWRLAETSSISGSDHLHMACEKPKDQGKIGGLAYGILFNSVFLEPTRWPRNIYLLWQGQLRLHIPTSA